MKRQSWLAMVSLVMTSVMPMTGMAEKGGFDAARHKAVLAQRKLEEAQRAGAGEKHKLLGEHMHMMKDAMSHMQGMKPVKEMSAAEHEQWMGEHQKLMDDMLGQMMADHEMMMGMKDCK